MNNFIESSVLDWMDIFLNEYFEFCFELNFELNHFKIQWKNEFSKRIEQGYGGGVSVMVAVTLA